MKDLIAKLESATEGSRELDRAIHSHIRGVEEFLLSTWPAYTTSLDAALTLVPEGWHWNVGDVGLAWVGTHESATKIVRHDGDAHTPALALCIAALKARAK